MSDKLHESLNRIEAIVDAQGVLIEDALSQLSVWRSEFEESGKALSTLFLRGDELRARLAAFSQDRRPAR